MEGDVVMPWDNPRPPHSHTTYVVDDRKQAAHQSPHA
ncbi:MAG: hypothetical protein ACI9MC_004022, partial [Kiritimatiellia bacterium]